MSQQGILGPLGTDRMLRANPPIPHTVFHAGRLMAFQGVRARGVAANLVSARPWGQIAWIEAHPVDESASVSLRALGTL